MTNTQAIQNLRQLQRETNDAAVKAQLQKQINELYDNMPTPKYF